MGRLFLWLMTACLLTQCGQIITLTPKAAPQKATLPLPIPTLLPSSTPLPTATPQSVASPTPIIYTVQAGDTIPKIARQFGLSTQELQEANGIIDPRFLEVGQKFIIPPPQESPAETPTPTPPPLVINLDSINFHETRQGTLWSLGEVHNPTQNIVSNVLVEIALLDGQGTVLARESIFTQLDIIQPDQSVPFAILFESPPSRFAQYQAKVVAAEPISDEAQTRHYFDLEVSNLQGKPIEAAIYQIQGHLHNFGVNDAESIRLVAVAYDEENQILAQRQADLEVTLLKAGATTPFSLDLMITHGIVDHYKVMVQALAVQ